MIFLVYVALPMANPFETPNTSGFYVVFVVSNGCSMLTWDITATESSMPPTCRPREFIDPRLLHPRNQTTPQVPFNNKVNTPH